jgi:Ala-tRNA(Pro) deacylase
MAIPASISAYLDRHQARYSLVPHQTAYTAQQEAAAAHVPGHEWAKAVVCFADDRPFLAVLAAPYVVDLERLKHLLNARTLRLANETEFRSLYTDCEVGAMPPFGPLYRQAVYVDRSLTGPEIAFNAGSHHDAIRMSYREFQRLVQPTVGEFGVERIGRSAGVKRRGVPAMVTDVVCGTDIEKENAFGRSEHRGELFYFCSQRCKMEFDDNPSTYARAQH